MKLVNYTLQNQIEYLSENRSNSNFKEYLQSILEDTSTPYYQRADYIGLSLNEIKTKIDYLSEDIQELQALKKKLSISLDIAKEQVADIFISNGIDRIDGNIISSLTLSKKSLKQKDVFKIIDENKVMGLGYVKFDVDKEAIEKALNTKEGKKELDGLVEITTITEISSSKVKVNTKRTSSNNTIETQEILIIEEQVA